VTLLYLYLPKQFYAGVMLTNEVARALGSYYNKRGNVEMKKATDADMRH